MMKNDNGVLVYKRDVQPNGFHGTVRLRPGDVMDLWQWPETCKIRQSDYALQRAIRGAVSPYVEECHVVLSIVRSA